MAKSLAEIIHDAMSHPFGRHDEAFEQHLHREKEERVWREQLALLNEQREIGQRRLDIERERTYALERMGDVVASLGYDLQEVQGAIQTSFRMSTKATVSAIAFSTLMNLQAQAEARQAIALGFRDLQAAFSFGLSQIVWQQEQTDKMLTDILAILKAPRKTEADEMRERGDEAYRHGINARRPEDRQQWMNLALQAYGDCIERNPADFSALLSIGMILFFERGISDGALATFRTAATFSEPYSPYHAAFAWLHLGCIRRCRQEFKEAYEATEEAVRLQPDWAEVHFQHAISCALTNRLDEMKEALKQAIRLDRNYCFRACTEPELIGQVA